MLRGALTMPAPSESQKSPRITKIAGIDELIQGPIGRSLAAQAERQAVAGEGGRAHTGSDPQDSSSSGTDYNARAGESDDDAPSDHDSSESDRERARGDEADDDEADSDERETSPDDARNTNPCDARNTNPDDAHNTSPSDAHNTSTRSAHNTSILDAHSSSPSDARDTSPSVTHAETSSELGGHGRDDEPSDEFVVDVEGLGPKEASGAIRRSWLNVAAAGRAQRRSDALHLSPGSVIPSTRYRIVRWIGDGGMGVVYEAENMDIGRHFAVKLLRQEVCTIPRATQLFRDEARAAARIGSANIVEIFDFAELPDGRLLYAMELLDGRPLAHEVVDTSLPPGRVIAILRQVCKGLAAAHAVQIIHRDIKPDNIFLCESNGRADAVKLLDFGIAVFMVGATVTDSNVTGTPHYLAPEIITGKPYDARVDIYALGCTAFEMLTGEAPFEGSIKELLDAHVHREPPSMASVRGDSAVPAELEAVIQRCISKDPAERYADMDDLEAALCEAQVAAKIETYWDDLPLPNVDVDRRDWLLRRMPDPTSNRVAPRSRRRPAIVILALGALLLIGALIAGRALLGAPVTDDPQLVRLEEEARELAAQVLFVYPPLDEPDTRTAYQVILDLEQIQGPQRPAALKLSRGLRREFGGTLAAFGERLWDRPGGREFAIDVYAQALIFDPDIEPAASRAQLTPGQLARLAGRAESRDFSASELLATEPLVVLAETGDLNTESPALERARERLAEQALDRENRLAQLTRPSAPGAPPLRDEPKASPVPSPKPTVAKTATKSGQIETTTESDGTGNDGDPETAGMKPADTPEPAARKRDPIAAAALVDQAKAAARRGADREAERLFEQALAQDSRCAEALAGLTEIHFNRGSYSRAFTFGKRAIKLAKDDPDLRVLVGDAAFKVFRYDEARIQYERAEELGHPQATRRLVKVSAKLGD